MNRIPDASAPARPLLTPLVVFARVVAWSATAAFLGALIILATGCTGDEGTETPPVMDTPSASYTPWPTETPPVDACPQEYALGWWNLVSAQTWVKEATADSPRVVWFPQLVLGGDTACAPYVQGFAYLAARVDNVDLYPLTVPVYAPRPAECPEGETPCMAYTFKIDYGGTGYDPDNVAQYIPPEWLAWWGDHVEFVPLDQSAKAGEAVDVWWVDHAGDCALGYEAHRRED